MSKGQFSVKSMMIFIMVIGFAFGVVGSMISVGTVSYSADTTELPSNTSEMLSNSSESIRVLTQSIYEDLSSGIIEGNQFLFATGAWNAFLVYPFQALNHFMTTTTAVLSLIDLPPEFYLLLVGIVMIVLVFIIWKVLLQIFGRGP